MVIFGLALQLLVDQEPPDVSPDPGPFLSNAWYCVPPSSRGFETEVATTNLGDGALRIRRSVFSGGEVVEPVGDQLEAHRSGTSSISDFGVPDAAMFIEVFGSASVADSLAYLRRNGVVATSCTVQPSDKWYFAHGSTNLDLDTNLLVANPFEEEAVIQLRVLGQDTDFVPGGLTDHVIEPLGVTNIFLGDFIDPETPRFGFEITATRGRVVITRYMRDSGGTVEGIAADVGVRSPSTRWYFAAGEVPKAGEERLYFSNPNTTEALIDIRFLTPEGSVEPDPLQGFPVPAGRQVVVVVSDHLSRGTPNAISVASRNGVSVVAERDTEGELHLGSGRDIGFGTTSLGVRWVVSVGSAVGGTEELSIANFGSERATVRVALLAADGETRPDELSALTVEPGRKRVVDLTPYIGTSMGTAVVDAVVGEILVERRIFMPSPYSDFADGSARPFG